MPLPSFVPNQAISNPLRSYVYVYTGKCIRSSVDVGVIQQWNAIFATTNKIVYVKYRLQFLHIAILCVSPNKGAPAGAVSFCDGSVGAVCECDTDVRCANRCVKWVNPVSPPVLCPMARWLTTTSACWLIESLIATAAATVAAVVIASTNLSVNEMEIVKIHPSISHSLAMHHTVGV